MGAGSRTDRRGSAAPWRASRDDAKHAMSAISPLKSCDVEKPQPQRYMPNSALVLGCCPSPKLAPIHARIDALDQFNRDTRLRLPNQA
jgi:hypothetical protein